MKIIIAGDGETGSHLAYQLSSENQDVVLMGTSRERLAELDARYNILTYAGNPVSPSALREAGVCDCDMFIAVTKWENVNIISAQLAKSLGSGRTVARIDNEGFVTPDIQELFAGTGVDKMVFPEFLAARMIKKSLRRNWVRNWFELHGGAIIVVGIHLGTGFTENGIRLSDLVKTRDQLHVCAIKRDNMMIIPKGNDILLSGDIVYFSILKGGEEDLMRLCGRVNHRIGRVMISGAGKIAALVAKQLAPDYSVTIIDADKTRCDAIAESLCNVTVVNADQRNIEILREEGIGRTDAFIALNESSEMNIIGCMLAKKAGVKLLVAGIEDIQYFVEAESLGINTVVNKKLLTSSNIFQMLLDTALKTPKCLALEDAEVLEIVVGRNAICTRGAVKNLKIPADMTIAGLVRDGNGMLVSGSTEIREGDHVVVFCLAGTLNKVENFFK